MELAGYPHVLAREAYALLELTGAAEAWPSSRAATQPPAASPRRVDRGARPCAVGADPGSHFRIVCGIHRDESWEIVADLPSEPRPTAAPRVAIRKLVDTAVTLDRYRREEKQRAALWPADTLETDGGLWVSEQMTELLSIARRIAPCRHQRSCSPARPAPARKCSRAPSIAPRRARPGRSSPSTAPRCRARCSRASCSATARAPSPAPRARFDGVIRAAAGGTLFLDEIAEIGPELQPKLLRFLETARSARDSARAQPVKVDVRVIAATNADLETLVAEGRFREDLFYRLNVVRLRLPPLRERREEIPPLIDHYLRRFADEQKKGRLTLDDETLEFLRAVRVAGQRAAARQRDAAASSPSQTPTAPSPRRCCRRRSRRRAAR